MENEQEQQILINQTQEFLNKVQRVVLIQKTEQIGPLDLPVCLLILKDDDYATALQNELNNLFNKLFQKAFPLLYIEFNTATNSVGLYIADEVRDILLKIQGTNFPGKITEFVGATDRKKRIQILLANSSGFWELSKRPVTKIKVVYMCNGYVFKEYAFIQDQ